MYPSTPTLTEELIQLIADGKPADTEIIRKYIENHDVTQALIGEDYYYKRNEIVNRIIYKYTNDGVKEPDPDATNNKLASGWHKLLVDQKVSYLVGSPISIGYKEEKDIEPLLDIVGDEFEDTVPELVKNAANKGLDWLHPYIDENGDFGYMIIPMQEFIPIYDNTNRKNLIAGIRYYPLDQDDVIKIEFWTAKDVTFYEMINGVIYLDANEEVNPAPHFYYNDQGYAWEKVPFVAFKNNEEGISDVLFYKDYIDMYDKIMSDTGNTLEDIQDFFYEIRGYVDEDIEHAVTNLKRYKGVAVDEQGGVGIVQGDVPIEAVNSYLKTLKENIFAFGQGVDVGTDKFGNSPSGIALKFLFSLLDMKADVLERKFTAGLKKFFWFVCEYASLAKIGEYDYQKMTFTFNKTMLMNDYENAQIAQMAKGVLSDETIWENHNWVKDVQIEKQRMEEQIGSMVDLSDQPIDGGDDE